MMGKQTKKTVKNKIVKLKKMGKTDKQILSIIPTVGQTVVTKVVREHRDEIERSKQKYIKLINKFSGGDIKQAKVLADAMKAEQDVFNFRGQVVGHRPDYKTRLKTIKYLDRLKGRETPNVKLSQTNNYIGRELDRYLK